MAAIYTKNKRPTIQPGERFGDWTVLGRKDGKLEVRCVCGATRWMKPSNLCSGKSRSCGCRLLVNLEKHRIASGKTAHKQLMLAHPAEYSTWGAMRSRCRNHRSKTFAKYGGRGIQVCERWDTFENFLADMGPKPSRSHSIDRIDNNGNYEPMNCRWATMKQQVRNRRVTVTIEMEGRKVAIAEAAERAGLNKQTVYSRIHRGADGDPLRIVEKKIPDSVISTIKELARAGAANGDIGRAVGVSSEYARAVVIGRIRRGVA